MAEVAKKPKKTLLEEVRKTKKREEPSKRPDKSYLWTGFLLVDES